MPTIRKPRAGSLQFWPRKRAKRIYPVVKSWAKLNDLKPLGFAAYKVGMTHIIYSQKGAKNKLEQISCPVTVLECPPLTVIGARFYRNTAYGPQVITQVTVPIQDKNLARKINIPKNPKVKLEDVKEFNDVVLIVATNPKMVPALGKKKPEIFEVALGGSKDDKLNYIKEKLGKTIAVSEVFSEGEQLDVHAVTKGKGFQGTVKRFGVTIKQHKSEKNKRGPGNIGPWTGGKMWTVPFPGKMGFHKRVDYNKWIVKIVQNPEELKMKGGWVNYGEIKNEAIIVKGSVSGPKKRIIRLTKAIRPSLKIPKQAPKIEYLSLESKQ